MKPVLPFWKCEHLLFQAFFLFVVEIFRLFRYLARRAKEGPKVGKAGGGQKKKTGAEMEEDEKKALVVRSLNCRLPVL